MQTNLLPGRQNTIYKGNVVDEAARKQCICFIKHLHSMSRTMPPHSGQLRRTSSRRCSVCSEPSCISARSLPGVPTTTWHELQRSRAVSACTGSPPTKAAHCDKVRFSTSGVGMTRKRACLKRKLRAQCCNGPLNLQRNLACGLYHQRLGRSKRCAQRVKDDNAERHGFAGARLGLQHEALSASERHKASSRATRLYYQVGAEATQRHSTLLHRRRLRKASLVQAAHELGLLA